MLRRSGRVVRVARVAVSGVVAVSFVPLHGTSSLGLLLLFVSYALLACATLIATFRNWWWDVRLAPWEGLADLIVTGVAVAHSGGYGSPFFVYGLLFVVAALIRWGWRESAIAVAAFGGVLLLASLLELHWSGRVAQIDAGRLTVRLGTLPILLVLIGWVASRRTAPAIAPVGEIVDETDMAADLAKRLAIVLRARRVTLWSVEGERLVPLVACGSPLPEALATGGASVPYPIVFNAEPARHARRTGRLFGAGMLRRGLPDGAAMASLLTGSGLAVPAAGHGTRALMIAQGVHDLNIETLDLAEWIAEQLLSVRVAQHLIDARQRAAMLTAKLDAAQDMHDTVVQSLAGASFRFQALKNWIANGKDPQPEIDRLLADLRQEQAKTRDYIGKLRLEDADHTPCDLPNVVREQLAHAARTWGIAWEMVAPDAPIEAPAWMCGEFRMMVSEGVSNAVRHGRATTVAMELARDGAAVALVVADDGLGLPAGDAQDQPVMPWSLHRRVQALGGQISLRSGNGTQITITVPLEKTA